MKFITSLSLHRIERQQYCLSTWEKHGDIVSVQSEKDIELLSPKFPNVSFVSTDKVGDVLYCLPDRVRIRALVDQGPGLLINSDIKITSTVKDFASDWAPVKKQFNVGVRYDFDGPGSPKKINSHGIDAFLITEEVMDRLPDLGFVIGVSVWDYWIIWHMMTERFRIKAKTTHGLLHLRHPQNWGDSDTEIGYAIMSRYYGLDCPKKILDAVIPAVTNRSR